jgi:hypothetical protein
MNPAIDRIAQSVLGAGLVVLLQKFLSSSKRRVVLATSDICSGNEPIEID